EGNLEDAVDRTVHIIKNRIDQYGVFEPIIQKMSRGRILVQLPGVDRERAKSLIGKTAQLTFHLVQQTQYNDVLNAVDSKIKEHMKDTLLFEEDPFLSLLRAVERIDIGVFEADYWKVDSMLHLAQDTIPDSIGFFWGPWEDYMGRRIRRLYLLKKKPEMTGAGIKDARHTLDQRPTSMGGWIVELEFNRKAGREFARITRQNINRRLAIVLDSVIQSAPRIKEAIPSGRAMIEGRFTPEEARDLAIVLRAGALPAPVHIIEERSVGPSLGRDSIRKGIRATLIAALVIVGFMLIYYAFAGLVADFTLLLNIFLLLGLLSALRGTLTMPGIAGIALTIGMSVDANILIFERIREELRVGKTVRTAIEAGFKRAWITIFDANMTTLITGIILYFLGTGPVKGFALTLSAGLIINLFSAVFCGRVVFDLFTIKLQPQKLRI
ncbi:MAG TPA: protein translocase subunit SecD, partial [bacterium (Candidatus Stahlbacteria)]|nr:protein translocase subunit SecD [Candidatus Stahlbacteria bacterium]